MSLALCKAYAAELLSTFFMHNLRILLCQQIFKDFHINENQSLLIIVKASLDPLQIITK